MTARKLGPAITNDQWTDILERFMDFYAQSKHDKLSSKIYVPWIFYKGFLSHDWRTGIMFNIFEVDAFKIKLLGGSISTTT